MLDNAPMTPFEQEVERYLRRNLVVNILDGGFFVLGLSFASVGTILPLFVSYLTHDPLLIGLVASIGPMGWRLPQLFMAQYVQQLPMKRPAVLWLTILERVPFLLLALLTLVMGQLSAGWILVSFYVLMTLQGFGGGLTANPWQELIAKIIPTRRRGSFFGLQFAFGGILASFGAIYAGQILETQPYPQNFGICFLITFGMMILSFIFLALTHEPKGGPTPLPAISQLTYMRRLPAIVTEIVRRDPNFGRFLISQGLMYLGTMASGFYTVYAVQQLGLTPAEAGIFASVQIAIQTVGYMTLGFLGDRYGHKISLEITAAASVIAPLCALLAGMHLAPAVPAFVAAYALNGLGTSGALVSGLSIVMEFSPETERPVYIGIISTLLAPLAFIAPLIGGWLVSGFGFQPLMIAASIFALGNLLGLHFAVREPRAGKTVEDRKQVVGAGT